MDLRSLCKILKLGPKLNAFPKRELIVWKLITDLGRKFATGATTGCHDAEIHPFEVRAMAVSKSWKECIQCAYNVYNILIIWYGKHIVMCYNMV